MFCVSSWEYKIQVMIKKLLILFHIFYNCQGGKVRSEIFYEWCFLWILIPFVWLGIYSIFITWWNSNNTCKIWLDLLCCRIFWVEIFLLYSFQILITVGQKKKSLKERKHCGANIQNHISANCIKIRCLI